MYLLDNSDIVIDAEFSVDLLEHEQCIVIESSGGENKSSGRPRRNPGYNALINTIFSRLAIQDISITRVILDSKKVQDLPLNDRTVQLDQPYPIQLNSVDIDSLRKQIGRKIANLHQAPGVEKGGNAQKRLRIGINRPIVPESLISVTNNADALEKTMKMDFDLPEKDQQYLKAARRGQGRFRDLLFARFDSVCPITGIANPDLLIASHIKPWNACTNGERLDPDNGILLSALVDRLFDKGLVTFSNEGALMFSFRLSESDLSRCGLINLEPIQLARGSNKYLEYHREFEFLKD